MDTGGDEQVLETDIMRFLAIIGIVFWIIFSVVKSIPFQAETMASRVTVAPHSRGPEEARKPEPEKKREQPAAAESKRPQTAPEPRPENTNAQGKQRMQESEARPDSKPSVQKAAPEKQPGKAKTPSAKGVRLEFENRGAILRLIREDRLAIYGRARATGFDLVFRGLLAGDSLRFKSAREIPRVMWELKGGEARQYFVDLMGRTYPSVRSFPEKKVQVAFLDKDLEKKVVERMKKLREKDRNGVLSVTGEGEVVFDGRKKEG
jgi:hypothetical protein